jgi:hypothetical protein
LFSLERCRSLFGGVVFWVLYGGGGGGVGVCVQL